MHRHRQRKHFSGSRQKKQRDGPYRLVPLSVPYGRYSSVIRYRLIPKALLRSMISGGILGRYFLLKLVSPK